MKLDVCIIATVRPEVLQMTLQSFTKCLLNQFECRAIINVDPAGDTVRHLQMDVVNLAREYFSEVIYRTPSAPSFSGAVQWCWQQVQTDFFFHLEDDWILRRKLDSNELVSLFGHGDVVGVTLNRRIRADAFAVIARAGKSVTFHNEFYVYHPGVSLNPSLFRTKYVQPLAHRFDSKQDPEYQINKLTKDDPELFLWHVSDSPLTIDIGKHWRKMQNIKKSKNDQRFSEWHIATQPTRARGAVRRLKWNTRKYIWRIKYCN